MRHLIHVLFLLGLVLAINGCKDDSVTSAQSVTQGDEVQNDAESYVNCPEVRPEMCTQMYDPVCGLMDSGIRCITTPCPSTTHKTFGNACTACSDEKVTSYFDGECPANMEQNAEAEKDTEHEAEESAKEPELLDGE